MQLKSEGQVISYMGLELAWDNTLCSQWF